MAGEFVLYSAYKTLQLAQATGSTNTEYSVSTAYAAGGEVVTASDALLVYAGYIKIKSDQAITIRFNATTNDPINIVSADGYVEVDNLTIQKIFISNASGSTANIKMWMLGKNKVSF